MTLQNHIQRAYAAYARDPAYEEAQRQLHKQRMDKFYDKYPEFKPHPVGE